MSRRPAIETPEDEEAPELWPEWEDWVTEGSGFGKTADNMIHRLYVGLGSMRVGNSSTKLRKEVSALAQRLLQLGVINEFQGRKIFNDYIRR